MYMMAMQYDSLFDCLSEALVKFLITAPGEVPSAAARRLRAVQHCLTSLDKLQGGVANPIGAAGSISVDEWASMSPQVQISLHK